MVIASVVFRATNDDSTLRIDHGQSSGPMQPQRWSKTRLARRNRLRKTGRDIAGVVATLIKSELDVLR
jgi:hypothetical protein